MGGSASTSSGGSPIKVALIAPFSGAEGYLGGPAVKGLDLALKDVAPDGKIDGHPVQVVKEDDQCSPTQDIQIVRKLISDSSVVATVGPICDLTPSQSIMAQAHLVHMTAGFTQSPLDRGDQYVFAGSPTTKQMMAAEMPLIEARHPSSVAILAGNDNFDAEVTNYAKQDLAWAFHADKATRA